MNKNEFLEKLEVGLSGLPQDDVKERLAFYGEMIDDRVEEGLSESEAVANIGSVEDIAAQIIADTPLTKIVKEKVKPRRALNAWEIVLIAVGSPVWLPLIIAAAAVIFSLYIVLWALIISLWAIEIALVASALCGIAASVINIAMGYPAYGIAILGAGLLLAGISAFLLLGCVAASKGAVVLTKTVVLKLKSRLIRKENAK